MRRVFWRFVTGYLLVCAGVLANAVRITVRTRRERLSTPPQHVEPSVRLLAVIDPEAPAKVRVPLMPPIKGDACCWGCRPEAVEPECLVHGTYLPA